MDEPEISVVVPLLNERATVDELVQRVIAALSDPPETFEIIFVDDGSTDGTVGRLRDIERDDPRVRVFEFLRNFGQAAALACGLFQARGDIVVTMDGDLQDPPEEIPRLLAAIREGAELVNGSRQGLVQAGWRRAGGRVVHYAANVLTGVRLEDYGGQFKAYRRSVVDTTRQAWGPGKPFFPLAVWLGFRVREIPVRHDARRSGNSRYRLSSLVRVNLDLITSFTTAPLVAMLAGGGVAAIAGGVALLAAAAAESAVPVLVLAATLSLTGSVFAAAGAVGVYVGRVYRTTSGSPLGFVIRDGAMRDHASRDDDGTLS